MQSKMKMKNSVNFSRVDLNEYNMTLGNNPSVSLGPPVCLDYTPAHDEEQQQQYTLSIDEYESIRNGKRRKPNHYRMKISKVKRLQILKQAGVSQKDIQSVERLVRREKFRRNLSYYGCYPWIYIRRIKGQIARYRNKRLLKTLKNQS